MKEKESKGVCGVDTRPKGRRSIPDDDETTEIMLCGRRCRCDD